VAVWPKTSRRENKSNGGVELEMRRDSVVETPWEGFPFMPPRDHNGHPKPSEVGTGGRSGSGSTGLDNGWPVRSRRRDHGREKEMAEWHHDVVRSWQRNGWGSTV
jgi:hypothetical protein